LTRDRFLLSLEGKQCPVALFMERGRKNRSIVISDRLFVELISQFVGDWKDLKANILFAFTKQSERLKEEWIDGQQVMDLLRIHRRALQNLRDKNILPYSHLGGKFYYKTSDIKKLLDANYKRWRGNKKE
jgi:hypothetical protein